MLLGRQVEARLVWEPKVLATHEFCVAPCGGLTPISNFCRPGGVQDPALSITQLNEEIEVKAP